jgi:hypothetical protein
MEERKIIRIWTSLIVLVCLALLVASFTQPVTATSSGNWWDVTPEPENPSPFYDSILYSEIAPKLREIERSSNRVRVDVIGQSAGGRNLFLVTLSAPEAMGRLGQYQAIRNTMLKDPEKAQEMIDRFGDFKVPVFINGSIHGNEYPGTDAAIRLIEYLATSNDPEALAILENVILLVNVVQNPDGRVLGTRANAAGIDLNRDFITQSQPEVQATVRVVKEWNPMIFLDLHGFVNPMLIEPCTPPHNPNYEYDLYIRWAFAQAEAMEAELFAQTGFSAQIPFRDFDLGWDDWPPTYAPMYAMFHGSYGHTLETSYRDARGVDAHYAAVWGALKFVAENRQAMLYDQIEIFRRGFLDLPQMRIPDELLDETQFDQYNDLIVKEFPVAYIIPPDAPFQYSDHQVSRLIDFLLKNDIQVEQASQVFTVDGVTYPKGSYLVWMDQPKRGLANTILESGPDLSYIEGLFFYSPPSVWSNPLLWGTYRAVTETEFSVAAAPVNNPGTPVGSVTGNRATMYAYEPVNLAAFQVTNMLLDRGEGVYRAPTGFTDNGHSFAAGALLIPGDPSLANELANQYGLDLVAVRSTPAGLVELSQPRIAVSGDGGVAYALRTLGFKFDTLSTSMLNAGAISGYDVFVNASARYATLNPIGQAAFDSFFAAGGDYVGLRTTGARFADEAGLLDFTFANADGNAIVGLNYAANDTIAGGFWTEDVAFVFTPVWFTTIGPEVEVAATLNVDNFLISGFWPGWQTSGAAGYPVVIHGRNGSSHRSLIGLDVTFRGHPENTFRLLANAIFSGQ